MSNGTTNGLATLIAYLATALYGYCCFLGLDFWLEGRVVVSALIALVAMCVLWNGMHKMVKGKERRNAREGRKQEMKAWASVLVVLVMGCPFFSKFMEINDYAKDGSLEECIDSTLVTARGIDSCYIAYAKDRVRDVKKKYRKSLKRRLLPEHIDSIAKDRQIWLSDVSKPNIWNVYSATNMNQLMRAAEKWTKEYHKMSSVFYQDEDYHVMAFEYTKTDNEIARFREMTATLHVPDWRGLMAMLVCLSVILISYQVTRRVKTGVE